MRKLSPDGTVSHYEGEEGAERMVRKLFPDGTVFHYEGEKGVEWMVSMEHQDDMGPHGDARHS